MASSFISDPVALQYNHSCFKLTMRFVLLTRELNEACRMDNVVGLQVGFITQSGQLPRLNNERINEKV